METLAGRNGGNWMLRPDARASAPCRLFCLPFAGAGASQFFPWKSLLPPFVELCTLQLPGREGRFREPAFVRADEAAEHVAREMLAWIDRPYALFGHSMGALLTFEVARSLRRRGCRLPFVLLLSGYPAPHLPRDQAPVSGLPKEQLIERLREMQGTPEVVLRDPELMNFLLPALRADFAICETYTFREEPPLPIPMVVFGGAEDNEAPPPRLEPWRLHTSAGFRQETLPGGHFFLHSSRERLLQHVVHALRAGVGADAGEVAGARG